MTRPSDRNPEETRPIWPLLRLFGILTEIAAYVDAAGQDVETPARLEAGVGLGAGAPSSARDVGEDQTEEEAA